MRILFVTGSYPPMKCGVGAYTQKLAHSLALRGECKVMVLTDRRANGANIPGDVEIHPVIEGWALQNLMRLVLEVRRLRPEVVHIQYPTQGYSGRGIFLLPLILRALGFPCVHTWHEPVLGRQGLLLALGLDHLVFVKRDLEQHLSAVIRWLLRNKDAVWIPAASMLPAVQLSQSERTSIKERYAAVDECLLVFYGFLAPLKGIETLLELVARTRSRLVLASDIQTDDGYHQTILERLDSLQIRHRVHITGFMPDMELAMLLASADAAVFPFKDGAADWNTSIDGAVAQGVFVLTTTRGERRYDRDRNIFYAGVDSLDEMKVALQRYASSRVDIKPADVAWNEIATAHEKIYRKLMTS